MPLVPTIFSMLKSLVYRGTLQLDKALARLPAVGNFRPLRGSFSALDHLRNGKLTGEILLESQAPGPCPHGSITELAGMRQHDHQPWPVFWTRSDDARLVGGMLHWRDPDDRLCAEGVFHLTERRRLGEDRYFAQILVPEPDPLHGAWISLASNWADGRNYFHWICDGLTRLSVREKLPEETRILLPAKTPAYIRETIEMLGLAALARTSETPCVSPERYYFCSPTAMTGVWNPLGFDWLREKFAPFRASESNGKPVFLTRRGGVRVPDGLHDIEADFASHGFDIIDCGVLTVREQIRITSAAPAIAGLHGAAMTNLLWARPETPVLEIFCPGYLNACYEQIAFQGKLRYSAVILDQATRREAIGSWLRNL